MTSIQLPDEVWTMILKHIPRQQLKKIRHTSKQIFHCGHYAFKQQTTNVGSMFHYDGTVNVLKRNPAFPCRASIFKEKSAIPYLRVTNLDRKANCLSASFTVLDANRNDTGKLIKRKIYTAKDGRPFVTHDAVGDKQSRKRYYIEI